MSGASFYRNQGSLTSDLVAVELDSGERVTVAPGIVASLLGDCLWFTKSGDHVAFCAEGSIQSTDRVPLASYEFSTGTKGSLGDVREVVRAPDGAYLVLTTTAGQIQLFEDADWMPRVLGMTDDPNDNRRHALRTREGAGRRGARSAHVGRFSPTGRSAGGKARTGPFAPPWAASSRASGCAAGAITARP